MTYWQGLFIIGLLWFILEAETPKDQLFQKVMAVLSGIFFTAWAAWELVQ